MAKRVYRGDRISELPVHIIHHILYSTDLDVKEAARSCILSKRWYFCCTSRPNLIFDLVQGCKYMPLENYVKLVDQSLRSHVQQNLHLEQLSLTYCDHRVFDSMHVDTWIELAFKLNVKVLEIYASFLKSYSLPHVIYDAKNLTTLRLRNCKFEFDISTTPIRFDCLGDLYLHCVCISDAQLQRIIDRAPFIRNLSLVDCPGINKLQVCAWPSTSREFDFQLCKFDSVTVQAPNLQCFKYVEHHHAVRPCKIDILDGYNTLQTLVLSGASITDQQFRDVFYKFPNISELDLTSCLQLKNIEIQSEKLKKFTLVRMESLEKVTIQAPNLLEFDFEGDKVPFSSMDPSSLERSQLNFLSPRTNFGLVDSSWYTNLHHFVQKFNYSKGLILAIFCRKTNNILIYENPREIVIPPSHDVEIFIAPIQCVESTIRKLMLYYPWIISILPCTNSKVLQVMSVLKGCTQKQNCGSECPFNTEYFHRRSKLKDVISCPCCPFCLCTGTTEVGITIIWYSWLKSTPLADQVKNFMLKWY